MATLKYSRQREAIKNYLYGRTDHPTADMVYTAIREVYPNISLGTVYRNLTLLAKQGEITKISCGESSDRFDARTDAHYHFICEKCGRVDDLMNLDVSIIDQMARKGFDGEIYGHQLYFFGICSQCKENKEK
ncbi:Fur family transcriptional regulator [Frisingicoccus sp.]|uniref:Fur family transcriptional regulator n=1 Tax=Frisingicoccus sp. TaxID=1918627 RepID=UPI00260901D3|nr:transcriptional repressor [Frisingicoccus sp.]MDD6232361.1 transcriptional repressor [Frisingicoccus sp.]MDY4834465.1 transcriptional repressor [Frisingicoccus sp.]MDY4922469.1 transcriptional repressor [Frisingicoccus sp.]